MRGFALLLGVLVGAACGPSASPPEPAPRAEPPPPAERVAAYEAEVLRICEDARAQVLAKAEATRCTTEAPARWESMVAESFRWMDQSRRPIQPEELAPSQPPGETRCEAVTAEPLTDDELDQLGEIAQAAASADQSRAGWAAAEDDPAALQEHLFSLEQLHGACLRLSASRL